MPSSRPAGLILPLYALMLFLSTVLLPTVAKSQGPPVRVVVLGSSTAEGAAASPLSNSWVNRYAAHLATANPGSEVINLAIGGYTTFNVMPTGTVPPAPWDRPDLQPVEGNNITAAIAYTPDLIILNLPTNDASLYIPIDMQMRNYATILGAAAAAGIPAWVSTPQPRNDDATARALLRSLFPASLEAFTGRVLDFWTGLGDAEGFILPLYDADGTHLNNAGHAVLYDRAVATISTAPPGSPFIAMHPRSRTVSVNDSTSFLVVAGGAGDLTYRWQRNGVDIPGAVGSRYAVAQALKADSGALYRCIVSDGVTSLATQPALLAVTGAATGPAGPVVSDDFSAPGLNTNLWTLVDPRGDATVAVTGTGTQNARLSITVPAGVSHDVWVGANNAPHLLQTVQDGDFQVEVKFESALSARYQMQGILVRQNDDTFLRFDVVRDASVTRFFSASFSGGTPTVRKDSVISAGSPVYLRVTRSGNAWSGALSSDGSTWRTAVSFTQPMTVTAIGPFAGNHGIPESASPAFTALVDYFFNTASPIVPEDGTQAPVLPAITTHPQSQSVTEGQSVTFNVAATGSAPLAYQWLRNGAPVAGANGSSFTIAAAAPADNGAAFRCVVSNTAGSDTSTAAVLTVSTVPPPPSSVVSDDFSGGSINTGLWTVINPLGDAVFSLTGTGTGDARLSIALPAGVSHDLWSGVLDAPRLLQPVPNTDFEIETRFESSMGATYQFQGIMIRQDDANFLRFDVVRDGSVTRYFSASFTGGTPAIRKDTAIAASGAVYLRVKRQGSTWTGSYSTNGSTWVTAVVFTRALTVTGAGPFAGNHGIPESATPAFTALVDYFFNTASRIEPEDGGTVAVKPTITAHPANVTVTAGAQASFSVTASGTAPFSYAWYRNGIPVNGANAATYTLTAALTDNGALFHCVVSNGAGAATSNSAALTVETPPPGPSGWWNTAWRYRVPVTVGANGYARTNRPAGVNLNFTTLLAALGQSGSLVTSSLRVIEVDGAGAVLDTTIQHQFDQATGFNPASNAAGTLTFLLSGSTSAGSTRTFHVYFDTQGSYPPVPGIPLITTTDNVAHEGQSSIRLVTQRGTYYYHKAGGGFASMEDLAGQDWIGYTPGGGSAGEYRGIPNLGQVGHPGYTNSTSTITHQGPLRTVISSRSLDGLWSYTWTVYPEFATLALTEAGGPFWMLYEGTPGGSLEPATDFWVRSSGQRSLAGSTFVGDLAAPEWAWFGDPAGRRFLFLAHHEDDGLEDQYWQMENNMTVFGFGRQYASTTPLMTALPAHLTVGFGEDTLQASLVINSAFRPLTVTAGTPESAGGTPPPPSGIVSDDFNAGSLNTALWTVVDPRGDATVSMTGSQLRIAIPAGTSHDVWTGENNAPRVLQPIPDDDLSVQAKFDTPMNGEYQLEGIMVLQDNGTFIRMDFVKDASSTRFFAASFAGGAPTIRADVAITQGAPLYLRVRRTGDTWTGSYSTNGTTWTTGVTFTFALTATAAGVFAGNAGGNPPAFTALVDHFTNLVPGSGGAAATGETEVEAGDAMTTLPASFMLDQNYPNPFNPSTTIGYGLPSPARVSVRIYNVLGEEVMPLVEGERAAGRHQVVFDATGLPSGLYLCRMQATPSGNAGGGGPFTATIKLLLVR